MSAKRTSPEQTLNEIKQLMERSSRFISLSGFSGIFAGIYALMGALAAWYYLNFVFHASGREAYASTGAGDRNLLTFLIIDAAVVLILAVGTGILLTTRAAKKDGSSLFDTAAKRLIINLAIPLVTGGLFCIALVYHHDTAYVAPVMLVFYGMALLHASKYTRDDIRTLGLAELCLGIAAMFIPGYGLIFWAVGFGVLHIVYGAYMYNKYEK